MPALVWILLAIPLFLPGFHPLALAQGLHHRKGWDGPPGIMEGWMRQLNLNEEQVARIRDLQESLRKETLPLRDSLMVKRFRLRELLVDPQADPKQILRLQREVSELEGRLQERIMVFHLEARKILRADQIKLLPPGFGPEPFPRRGVMPGRFRGMGPP